MIKDNILRKFVNMRCLVTGGTGLIGRQVVDILKDAKVFTVSLEGKTTETHFCADLTNPAVCHDLVYKMDYVFHLAGLKGSVEDTKNRPADYLVPMLIMNTNLLEACRLAGVKKVVYTSSIGAYANSEIFVESQNQDTPPMDTYPGWAKRMGELQIKAYRTQYGLGNFSIVRIANCYGPGDRNGTMVISSLMNKISKGEDPVVIWGDGSAIRDFVYSKDAAEGIILALYYGTNSGFINIGSGRGYSIKELVETLRSFIDFNYEFDNSKPSGFSKRVMDISLAKKILGYKPTTSLLDGLKETWEADYASH